MKLKLFIIALLTCLVNINVSAETGTWTDENGTTWTFYYDTSEKTAMLFGQNTFESDPSSDYGYIYYPCISGAIPTELIVPDSVYVNDVAYAITSIGDFAFIKCSDLTSITIPEGVTTIGYASFHDCSSITSINIPEGVTTIGGRAFYGCSSLTSINIPKGVTTIGGSDFYGCSSLSEVHIADLAAWLNVAFGDYYATPLRYAHHLYMNGEEITELVIPEEVTAIPASAFYGCSNITSVTIPASVTTIGDDAFSGCESLSKVYIADLAAWFNISFDYSANPLLQAHHLYLKGEEITELIVPEGVTAIGSHMFRGCTSLTTVTIPEGVTNIGSEAFLDCSNLTSVTIPASVTTIGSAAFAGCSCLTNVTIPASITTIESGAFNGCSNLNSVTIPEGVTTIAASTFSGCSSLTSITIPEGVTTIESSAFSGCSSLTSITIPEGVTTIGGGTFNGCSSLTSINIPEGVTEIGSYAFSDCSSLTSVNIPKSMKTIGWAAFYQCSSLSEVHIADLAAWFNISFGNSDSNPLIFAHHIYMNGEEIKDLVIPEGVTSIGNHAFANCSSLTSITIPESVTTIGTHAFWNCSSLECINIPEGVTTIGYATFDDCSSLKNITIPEGVTSIGDYAFDGCSSLECINIPEGVTSIGDYAFDGCSSLTRITIPEGVTTIGDRAFDGCYSLTTIILGMRTPIEIEWNTFELNDNSKATLYVLKGSKTAYQAADVWKDFEEIVEYNYIGVAEQTIAGGETATLEIGVYNGQTDLVAFQMDLTLPEGISLDKTGCSLSSRITDEEQELTIGKLENGAYRLTSSSLSLKPISGTEGTLLTLKLTATEDCDDGQATISNIRFSTAGSKRVDMPDETFDIDILHKFKLTYKLEDEVYKTSDVIETTPLTLEAEPTKDGYTFGGWSELPETMPGKDVEITGRFYLYGDVNTDEEVDVVDVVDIARFVVATPSGKFREKLADLNKDNSVNLGDAVVLVNHIAGDVNFVKAMAAPNDMIENGDALSLTKTGKTLALNLTNRRAYTAFQFDLYVDDEASVTQMALNGQRKQEHQLLYNKVENGHYRVAVLSTSNRTFNGNEGELLSFVMDAEPSADTEIRNIRFFDTKGNAYAFDAVGIGLETGIGSMQDVVKPHDAIYDLQGRKLTKVQRGVNIVNGKTLIIKK